jgi:hypothetical protein
MSRQVCICAHLRTYKYTHALHVTCQYIHPQIIQMRMYTYIHTYIHTVCSGNGLCLDNGECQCLSGYGGERCQFKNREVQKFGSMSALAIVISMLITTLVLVGCVVVKVRMSTYMCMCECALVCLSRCYRTCFYVFRTV